MRKICEKCESEVSLDETAFICSFECTFCEDCKNKMNGMCPNCGGELVRRPKRKKTT
jgi:hypothetical protein